MAARELAEAGAAHFGPIAVSGTVLTTWGIMIVLAAACAFLTRGLREDPGPWQAALEGIVVFGSVHWFGIRIHGLARYLRHYLEPNPLLLPFHLVSEVSRTIALAVRLFGNMFSLEMAALLVLLVAGLLVPVPVLLLHIVEALVQAYIFGMLALIYIAGGVQSLAPSSHDTEGAHS